MIKSKETEVVKVVPVVEEKYFCAGRHCTQRDTCHRHTSSSGVNKAPFEDYDLVMIRELPNACKFYIDRNEATGVNSLGKQA